MCWCNMRKEQEERIYQQAYEEAKLAFQAKKNNAENSRHHSHAHDDNAVHALLKLVLIGFLVIYFGKKLLAMLTMLAFPVAMIAHAVPQAILLILLIILIIKLL